MNGAYTLLGACLLLAFTLLASLTVFLIGRRVAYPASVAAYGAAVAALVADPLLSVANLHRVDRVVGELPLSAPACPRRYSPSAARRDADGTPSGSHPRSA